MTEIHPFAIEIHSKLPRPVQEALYVSQAAYVQSVCVHVTDAQLQPETRALLMSAYASNGTLLLSVKGRSAYDIRGAYQDARRGQTYTLRPSLRVDYDFVTTDTPMQLSQRYKNQLNDVSVDIPLSVIEPLLQQLLRQSAELHSIIVVACIEADRLDALRAAQVKADEDYRNQLRAEATEREERERLAQEQADLEEEELRAKRNEWLRDRLQRCELDESAAARLKAGRLPVREMVEIVRDDTFSVVNLARFRRFVVDKEDPVTVCRTEVRTVHTAEEFAAYNQAKEALQAKVVGVRNMGITMDDARVEVRRHTKTTPDETIQQSTIYCAIEQFGLKLSREFEVPEQGWQYVDSPANTDE
jgi:hypothetical protein